MEKLKEKEEQKMNKELQAFEDSKKAGVGGYVKGLFGWGKTQE